MSVNKTLTFLVILLFVSCVQTVAPQQEIGGSDSSKGPNRKTKTFSDKGLEKNLNLVFRSQHKPLNSLDYIQLRVSSAKY